jgi:hypothetical protein
MTVKMPQWGIHYENGRRTSFRVTEEDLATRSQRLSAILSSLSAQMGSELHGPVRNHHYSDRLRRDITDSYTWEMR